MFQQQRFESLYPRKDRVIRDQPRHLGMDCGRRLQCVGSPHPMGGTDPGSDVRDFEIRGNPIEIGIRCQQSVEFSGALLSEIPIRLNQQFRRGDGGGYRCMTRPLQPGEDGIGEADISRVGFRLVDKDARIQCDPRWCRRNARRRFKPNCRVPSSGNRRDIRRRSSPEWQSGGPLVFEGR